MISHYFLFDFKFTAYFVPLKAKNKQKVGKKGQILLACLACRAGKPNNFQLELKRARLERAVFEPSFCRASSLFSDEPSQTEPSHGSFHP